MSFFFASKGIYTAFREQLNLTIHVLAATLVVAAGVYFNITLVEWLTVLFAVTFVLATELFNTAIEYLVDLVSPDYHPLAGKVKDVAAGAVLVAAISASIVGVVIFGKYILELYVQQM